MAEGSGTTVQEVNKLLKNFEQTKLMMKQMKNKKMILIAVAVVAVAALMLGVYLATRPETKAGSKTVYELHGSVHRNYCRRCAKFYSGSADRYFESGDADIDENRCGGIPGGTGCAPDDGAECA